VLSRNIGKLLIILESLIAAPAVSAAPTICYCKLTSILINVTLRVEQSKSFSPEFIFVRLARGPPNLT
jgi:hypothetical protein